MQAVQLAQKLLTCPENALAGLVLLHDAFQS